MREKLLIIILFITVLSCLYFYFTKPRLFIIFIKTMRLSRHVYYTVIFSGGYFLGLKRSGLFIEPFIFIAGIFLINLLFASSLAINNIFDRKIDSANSKENILNSGAITQRGYYAFFFTLLGLSLLLSLAVSEKVFFITALIHFFSWIYSSPPLHLKKVFLANTFLIALSSLLAMLLGFAAAADFIAQFPINPALTLIIVLFLSFNTKDVNDFKGDKKYGVKTIVTVFGRTRGKIITAALALAGYLLVPVLLNTYSLLVPSAIFGGVTYAVINTKTSRINETMIFGLFFAYAAVFAFMISPAW